MDLYATNGSLIQAVQSRMAKRRNDINFYREYLDNCNIPAGLDLRKDAITVLRNHHKSQMLDKKLLKILYKLDYFSIVL